MNSKKSVLFGLFCLIYFISGFLLSDIDLFAAGNAGPKYIFTELFTIGSDGENSKKDDPYLFDYIMNISCDKEGNIYAMDYKAKCVKKFNNTGTYMRSYFSSGKGPQEISNPYTISINPYKNHMYVLQDYGLTMKEFDMEGKDISFTNLPKQFSGNFLFLNKDEFLCKNNTHNLKKFNNFFIVNSAQKKIIKEFAPTEMDSSLNRVQAFALFKDSILWTSRGDDMMLFAYDIKTGRKLKEIKIPGDYKNNTIVTRKDGDLIYAYVILYNCAQPFIIDNQLFVLVIVQDYQIKDGKIDRFPISWKRTIYQVNGNRFDLVGELKDSEDMFVGTVWKNRLLLISNEPYGRIKVLEFKKK